MKRNCQFVVCRSAVKEEVPCRIHVTTVVTITHIEGTVKMCTYVQAYMCILHVCSLQIFGSKDQQNDLPNKTTFPIPSPAYLISLILHPYNPSAAAISYYLTRSLPALFSLPLSLPSSPNFKSTLRATTLLSLSTITNFTCTIHFFQYNFELLSLKIQQSHRQCHEKTLATPILLSEVSCLSPTILSTSSTFTYFSHFSFWSNQAV